MRIIKSMHTLQKTAIKESDVPNIETMELYVEALKLYRKDDPSLSESLQRSIDRLPTPRKIRLDYSYQEARVLFETISYLWRKITGQDIIEETKITKAPESLLGNYWIVKNGILLSGINHYSIIKQNANMIGTLLNINGFAIQHYLALPPENIIQYIIRNGGVRVFIRKDKKGYFQMSENTYAKWGKLKIKKFDLKEKIVKIIDLSNPYEGWNSGIPIKL